MQVGAYVILQRNSDCLILVGVHGVKGTSDAAPTHVANNAKKRKQLEIMYGASWNRIERAEAAMNARFEQRYQATGAVLWPNIALRF